MMAQEGVKIPYACHLFIYTKLSYQLTKKRRRRAAALSWNEGERPAKVFAINESANTQAAQIATNFFYTLGTWKYGIAIVQRAYVCDLHALCI
jgi:hypothetical protein